MGAYVRLCLCQVAKRRDCLKLQREISKSLVTLLDFSACAVSYLTSSTFSNVFFDCYLSKKNFFSHVSHHACIVNACYACKGGCENARLLSCRALLPTARNKTSLYCRRGTFSPSYCSPIVFPCVRVKVSRSYIARVTAR